MNSIEAGGLRIPQLRVLNLKLRHLDIQCTTLRMTLAGSNRFIDQLSGRVIDLHLHAGLIDFAAIGKLGRNIDETILTRGDR